MAHPTTDRSGESSSVSLSHLSRLKIRLLSLPERFGYPHSVSGAAGERRYAHEEVIALRDSLEAGRSITAAIDKARGVGADS